MDVLCTHTCYVLSYLVIPCHGHAVLKRVPWTRTISREDSSTSQFFSRHFVTLAQRVPCFRSRKEHSWTDVFSESIGIAGQQVCPLTHGLQHVSVQSHSTSFHLCERTLVFVRRSWRFAFSFGETMIQLARFPVPPA